MKSESNNVYIIIFFFHDLNEKVTHFDRARPDCQAYTDKKTSEHLAASSVSDKTWSKIAVDLYGPLLSCDHIVVVQNMASRFPGAKLVKSTKANNAIPAVSDIYDNYGNPETQLSDISFQLCCDGYILQVSQYPNGEDTSAASLCQPSRDLYEMLVKQ